MSKILIDEATVKLALEVLKVSVPVILGDFSRHSKATAALREALEEQPAQYFDEVVYDGSSTAEALKRFQENVRPTSLPDAFEQLMRESDKPTKVPEQLAKYAAALVSGTHEITNLTIRPKRTWVGLTDEDVRQCSRDVVAGGPENSVDRFAYAIEAKLKERNQ